MRPLRFGVLGCADIALRRILPAMAALPAIQLVAVASRKLSKAREVAGLFGCRPVSGYAALLELDDVDAVYVPLPPSLHADWAEAALRSGKHVLAEKPLTTSAGRTRELLDLAQTRGLVLAENIMFIHHSQHAVARQLVTDGAIGELRSFHASFAVPELPGSNIRYQSALGGGALRDTGIYPLRAAMYFLGGDLTVIGATLTASPGREVDTSGAALLCSTDGTAAQLTFGLEHAYCSAYELRGSEGRLSVDRAFTPPADHQPVLRLQHGTDTREIRLNPDDQVANTLTAFASAARNQTATARAQSAAGHDSLRLADLLDDVRGHAALHGQEPPARPAQLTAPTAAGT